MKRLKYLLCLLSAIIVVYLITVIVLVVKNAHNFKPEDIHTAKDLIIQLDAK